LADFAIALNRPEKPSGVSSAEKGEGFQLPAAFENADDN
jgi:hypothetical protein